MTETKSNQNRRKPPTEGTCAACTHFSQAFRKRASGFCMKHRSSTKSNSTCAFYKKYPQSLEP